MASFRVESVEGARLPERIPPVGKPKYKDSLGPGHTGDKHNGVDVESVDGNRDVIAPATLRIVRLVDGTKPDARKERKNAGPYYVDARELDSAGAPGLWLRFLHLEKPVGTLTPGETIARGTVFAKYDPKYAHLHFEVRKPGADADSYGDPVEPKEWLSGKARAPSQARLVALLDQEGAYNGVPLRGTLYAESGHRLIVTAKPGFPWLSAEVQDPGEPSGKATTDIGEAAEWTLAAAKQDTEYSWKRDGILGLNSWAYRVRALRDDIEKARSLPPAERYARAWELRKEMGRIRSEGVVQSQANAAAAAPGVVAGAAKSAAKTAAESVKQGASDLAGGLWDSIPAAVKVGGAALLAVGVVKAVSKDD